MGNGRRQYVGRRHPVEADDLAAAIACVGLRELPAPPLDQQPRDDAGLEQHRRDAGGQLRAVLLPDARSTKVNLTSLR